MNRPISAACALLMTFGTPALADITAADVWSNYQAFVETFGITANGDLSNSGNQTIISDVRYHLPFPNSEAAVELTTPEMVFTNNSDGTVSQDLSRPVTYGFMVTNKGDELFSGDLLAVYEGVDMMFSGTPDAVNMKYRIGQLSMELRNVEIALPGEEVQGVPEFKLSGKDLQGDTTLEIGDTITASGETQFETVTYSLLMPAEEGNQGKLDIVIKGIVSKADYTIPREGWTIQTLNAALRNGMRLNVQASNRSYETKTTTILADGGEINQLITQGPTDVVMRIGQAGFEMEQHVDGMSLANSPTPAMPFPINVQVEKVDFDINAPLSQEDGPQDFRLNLAFEGLTLDESLWAMFDPAQALPRDPATLALGFDGKTKLSMDMLDIAGWQGLNKGERPISLEALTLTELDISAAGTRLTGTGDFTFNNDDLATYGGFPAPSGVADFQLSGANALIDTLISMGVIADSDAMGARMMMGMLAVPGEGEDTLNSKIEITEDGKILANGQRLK